MKFKIGDEVLIEQAWEDEQGNYHDEFATVSKILPNGTIKFRIGHWKKRKSKDQRIQAWLNKQEWYEKDLQLQ